MTWHWHWENSPQNAMSDAAMGCNGAVAALGSNCLASCTPADLFANSQGPSASCLNAGAPA